MSTEDKSVDVSLVNGPVNYEEPPFYRQGGGENAFLGRTRHEESASHGILKLLRYEAKESMATKMLQQIAQEAMDRHQLLFVRIRHSVGEVPVGDASVLVQVIGIHRKETFEATAEIMDRLKKKVIPNRVGKSYSIPLSGSYMEAGGLGVGCDMERRECRRSICMRYNWTVFRSFTAD
mmetsp:Transcript_28689/g.92556  ORF Transcript_28689/g.92556 Transcript_28689/m.92556 type:complete len:178 (-) Transcript_28689:252-785(-)